MKILYVARHKIKTAAQRKRFQAITAKDGREAAIRWARGL